MTVTVHSILLEAARAASACCCMHWDTLLRCAHYRPQQAKSQEGEDRKPAEAHEVKLCLAQALPLRQMQDAHAKKG